MNKQYLKVFSLKSNFYTESSPVLIEGGVIRYNKAEDFYFAQLKFKNVSDKTISGLSVILNLLSNETNEEKNLSFDYKNLAALAGESFAAKQSIALPKGYNKQFSIVKIRVEFENEIWESENEWAPIKQEKITTLFPDYYQQIAYRKAFGKNAKRVMVEYKNFWLCTCGAACNKDEELCPKCKASREALKNISPDSLREKGILLFALKKASSNKLVDLKAAREALNLASQSEDVDKLKSKTDILIAKKKKQVKNIALCISIPLAAVAVILLLVFFVIIPILNPRITYTFETNGGFDIDSYTSSEPFLLPVPLKSGYEFVGWYTDPSLDEDSKVAENEAMCYESDKDITLYAKWKISYGDGSTIDKAKLLTENGYFYTTNGSTMYFKFTATESKTYTFSSSCLSDVDATLYSSSRVELSEDISYGDFYISHYLYAGETVYLRVIPYSGGIYSCTISVE